jgi:hypothetical protein
MKNSGIHIFLLLISATLFAQNNVVLVHKYDSTKIKPQNLSEKFEIKTNNNYYHSKIISCSKTEIKIIENNLKHNGTNTNPFNWVNDTIMIPIQEINYLKTYRYNKRQWVMPFAAIGALTLGSVFFTPLVFVTKGRAAADRMTVIQLAIIVITLPPVLIGISKKKYDLKNKWKIKVTD